MNRPYTLDYPEVDNIKPPEMLVGTVGSKRYRWLYLQNKLLFSILPLETPKGLLNPLLRLQGSMGLTSGF